MKSNYKYIFVVLVYKNTDVLEDFFNSLTLTDSKVIVVNSFYDEQSEKKCKEVALNNSADYISVPNKGYGYGNNVGTQFVMEHYDYDFLVISNSDIVIKKIDTLEKYRGESIIIAPKTTIKTGKHQNPDTPWELKFIYPMLSYALNHKNSLVYTLCHIFTRLNREIFKLYSRIMKKEKYQIFSAHGSFFIVPKPAVDALYPFFDNEMFLYNEEWYLALKARKHNIPVYYIPDIEVLHLEGASSSSIVYSEHDRMSFNILNQKRKKGLI